MSDSVGLDLELDLMTRQATNFRLVPVELK